ncbi:Aste57867_16716 [Aphanomyces stellatus]|uniref:Aste57867_16716 protein n=1 Tax=Aphanomyces stellatus TaxID=120398 RepID=A0A485L987_9STRA|nr:hypothetical protein As57867_016659 [Aphanomyces stellatus]VFT93486.1 Aste57867_16716 [Aphanomyces stellatus]
MACAAPTSPERLALEAQQAADLRQFDAEWSQFRVQLGNQQTRAVASLHAMHAKASSTAANLEATARGELLHAHEQQREAARRLAQPWPPPALPPPATSPWGGDPQQVKRAVDGFLDHVHVVPLWPLATGRPTGLQLPDNMP